MGGKMCKIFERFLYLEKFMFLPFKKVIEYLFKLKLKYEGEENALMVELIKLCMNSLYGQSFGKNIHKKYIIRSENWVVKNNEERIVEYEPLTNGEYVNK